MEVPADAAATLSRRSSPASHAHEQNRDITQHQYQTTQPLLSPNSASSKWPRDIKTESHSTTSGSYFLSSPPPSPCTLESKIKSEYGFSSSSSSSNPSHQNDERRLLRSSEVPAWYAANQHILTGYRPVTSSNRLCLKSLTHVHNETANIYSHLIPCLLAMVGNFVLDAYFASRFPGATLQDRLVFHIFLTGAIVCFGLSASYHTFLCHSEKSRDMWLRMDYVGIVVQILGSFVSGIYMGFYCETGPRRLYWGMIGTLCTMTCVVMLHPRFQSPECRLLRLWTFIVTGLSGFIPIFHAMVLFPHHQLVSHMGIKYYYLEGIIILTGALFYGLHYPEKWFPVKFDIWGSSHTIFHVCVVLGAVAHFFGILSAYDYTYHNPRC